jgi:hypothetical protein
MASAFTDARAEESAVGHGTDAAREDRHRMTERLPRRRHRRRWDVNAVRTPMVCPRQEILATPADDTGCHADALVGALYVTTGG